MDAADTDEDGVITGLEAGVIAGLLTEPGPGRVRFVHALVRDTVYADLTQLRLTRMHARVGAAIRRLRPGDVPALAHHYLRAASADSAEAAVGYAIKAAERADRRYAYDAAVSLLEQALGAFARTPGSESERAEQQADLLGRLLRAQIRAGRTAAARATRQRAADAAASAGRDDLVTAAFAAWTVLAHVEGRFDDARRHYAEATEGTRHRPDARGRPARRGRVGGTGHAAGGPDPG